MTVAIHALQTGSVRIKTAQLVRAPFSAVRILTSRDWTAPLPIYCWLIEHPEGPILVDTGQCHAACTQGYLPRWHPYYRYAVAFQIAPEDDIGPSLARLGLSPADLRLVIVTHLHTDHAGGLDTFAKNEVFVSEAEWRHAQGWVGRVRGFLPAQWPKNFAPRLLDFPSSPYGPFAGALPVTKARDVVIVPTPGHTPGHISVIVTIGGLRYFLAGDASYTQAALIAQIPDGVTFFPHAATDTLARIRRSAQAGDMVYLPAHDPESEQRLRSRTVVDVSLGSTVTPPLYQ